MVFVHSPVAQDDDVAAFGVSGIDLGEEIFEGVRQDGALKSSLQSKLASAPAEGVAENGSVANACSGGETSPSNKEKPKTRKKTFKEQREFENLENEIMELEEKKSELEEQMACTDFTVAQKAGEEYKIVEEKLNADYARWEILAELG